MKILEEHYGTIYVAPDSIRLFLIGSDTDKSREFRMLYKDAALEKLEEEAMMRQ